MEHYWASEHEYVTQFLFHDIGSPSVLASTYTSYHNPQVTSPGKIQKSPGSVGFAQCSLSVRSDSLRHHGLQHIRLSYPSPTPGACLNSCPLSQGCHPTISSSVVPFSSCLQFFPASGTLPVSHIRWPKYCNFSFSISTSNEYSGLISFKIDWLDLLAVQGTLKSLLPHHSSKASILWHSDIFLVQFSHPYMTTGKTIALARQTFVGRVMFLLLNMLTRLDIAILPRSKSLNFMAAVTTFSDFGVPQNKVCHCFPIYLPWGDWTGCHDLSFLNVES